MCHVTLKLAEMSVVKSRPSVPSRAKLLIAQSDVSLWASIGFTQKAQRTAFTRPAITPSKVNRFGLDQMWNVVSKC